MATEMTTKTAEILNSIEKMTKMVPPQVHNAILHAFGDAGDRVPYNLEGALAVYLAGFRLLCDDPSFVPNADTLRRMNESAPDLAMVDAATAIGNSAEIRQLAIDTLMPDALKLGYTEVPKRVINMLVGAALTRIGTEVYSVLKAEEFGTMTDVPFMAPMSRYSH